MSDWLEDQQALSGYRREERTADRTLRTPDILRLADVGYTVKAFTDFHFRISLGSKCLDLFPTRGRFHNLQTNKRGSYISAAGIAEAELGTKEEARS